MKLRKHEDIEIILFLVLFFFLFHFFIYLFSFYNFLFKKHRNGGRRVLWSTRTKDIWIFWDEDIDGFESVNDDIVTFWRHAMTEDIVVFEMWMMVIVAFEGMQWLKTLSSSKCKWWSLLPLKACNDRRHWSIPTCHLTHLSLDDKGDFDSLETMKVSDHDGLCVPSDLIVSG